MINREGTHRNPRSDEGVLDALFRLPVSNLESRVLDLEDELRSRLALRNKSLSALGTHRLALEDAMFRMRYAPEVMRAAIRGQILNVEALKWAELRSAFRDTLKVRERLQDAREALRTAHVKRSLVMYGAGLDSHLVSMGGV